MYNFNYQKAHSQEEAVSARQSADDGTYLAGGMTPSDLIDLSAIADMVGITADGNSITIGAMTTHATVSESDLVKSKIPALAGLAGNIGDPQVRNRGTIGGSVANNDPAADYPAGCLGLNATIITNTREIAAEDFFTNLFETALEEGELITAVKFPIPDKAAYAKFPNPASRYAIVGVMVVQTNGETRAAVTGASDSGVFRATDIEKALGSNLDAAGAKAVKVLPDGLNSDIHASAEYRAHLISIMASRAAAAAA